MSPARIKVREGLRSKCYVYNQLQATNKEANLAYLDQLTSGVAEITTEDNFKRVEGGGVWKANFSLTRRDSLTFQQVRSNKALRAEPYRQYVHATTRAQARARNKTRKPALGKPNSPGDDDPVTLESHVEIGDDIKLLTWLHFMRKCSLEVTDTLNNVDKSQFCLCRDGIWRYYGRLLEREHVDHRDIVLDQFFDSNSISYVQPVGLANAPFVYTLVMDLHWKVHPHCGVYKTNRLLSNIMHVIKAQPRHHGHQEGHVQHSGQRGAELRHHAAGRGAARPRWTRTS